MRPGCRYSSKPARARPVFWMWGLRIERCRPSAPLSSSTGRPMASARPFSRPATVTDRGVVLRLRFDQSHVAVGAAKQHVDLFGCRVAEDQEHRAPVGYLDRRLV